MSKCGVLKVVPLSTVVPLESGTTVAGFNTICYTERSLCVESGTRVSRDFSGTTLDKRVFVAVAATQRTTKEFCASPVGTYALSGSRDLCRIRSHASSAMGYIIDT